MVNSLELLKSEIGKRYSIERELGRGGMATVYLAEEVRHQRKVAIKVLHPQLAQTLARDRFLREINLIAHLQHPNILGLLDSGEAHGLIYYVMPFVDGMSLRQRLASVTRLSISDSIRILVEVVDALVEAHRHGIVHRDIKPDNVMLSGRHALVADFGIAKAVNEAAGINMLTSSGIAVGTPAYMAPEQFTESSSVDHRADIYALGVMGYEMLAGRLPFAGESATALFAAHLNSTPQSLKSLRPEVPVALNNILLKCLRKSPADRWQSAAEVLSNLEEIQSAESDSIKKQITRRRNLALVAGVGAATVIGVAILVPLERAAAREKWVAEKAIPEIERMVDKGQWQDAYLAMKQATAIAPHNSALSDLWQTFSRETRIETDPPGARVFRNTYPDTTGAWEDLGTTPVRVHYPYDPSRLRFECEGYRTLDLVVDAGDSVLRFQLDRKGVVPEEMVRVPAWETMVLGNPTKLGAFYIDRFETTNRQFKQFVDAGGYRRRELWNFPFTDRGKLISWEEARARFIDRTGRPGPSTWEAGDYPAGQDSFPVSGISWFEAAAFARFAGKDLPTAYHWTHAHGEGIAAWIFRGSNLEGDAVASVGKYKGMSAFGAYDMSGNVREWTFNAQGDQRLFLGGGWNDPEYLAGIAPYAQDPFDRSITNGVRLAKYISRDSALERARLPIPGPGHRDFRMTKPVSDDVFDVYRHMYAYDKTPLDPKIESIDTAAHWIRQKISFTGAYGRERMKLYLFLPKSSYTRLQTVIYFPGSAAVLLKRIDQWRIIHVDFVIKSGRALAFPIYKGTFEREDSIATTRSDTSNLYKDHVIKWSQDLQRSLDYLETRPDIDSTKFAFYGYSWGGKVAPIMLSLEPRLKVGIAYIGGIGPYRAQPEVDELTYVRRVKAPMLLLSGRFDETFPLEYSAKPMFALLGTAAKDKRHVISDGGHFVPREQLIREILDWLDRYFGPVK